MSTTAPPPDMPGYLLVSPEDTSTNVPVSWGTVDDATQYRLEYKLSSASSWIHWTTTTSNGTTVTGLSEYTDYDFRVRSEGSGGNSDWRYEYSNTTADLTIPIVDILGWDSAGHIHFRWESSDPLPTDGLASGIRSTDGHVVFITKKNSTTFGSSIYLSGSTTEYSFTEDADGLPFENGAQYTIRVRSIDTFGNWSLSADKTIVYESVRPSDWSWSVTLSGDIGTINWTTKKVTLPISATEWNDFTDKINQFRLYKSLTAYSFSSASTGSDALDSQINQARLAIDEMVPPTSVPSSVSKGGDVTSYTFNRLRDSLNSIQ